MHRWLLRLSGLLYVFALLWLCFYLYWTLSDDGVQSSGWIYQIEAFSLFVLLVLLGVVVGLFERKPLISRLLLIFFVCACTFMTYANTSWNLFDATTRRKYSIFRGYSG